MKKSDLASRLTNYADALVATGFILMTALGNAVGDPDVRCELADAAVKIMLTVGLGGLGLLFSLHWLMQSASRLRTPQETAGEVGRVNRRLNQVRYVLLSVFVLLALYFVGMSLTDASCV